MRLTRPTPPLQAGGEKKRRSGLPKDSRFGLARSMAKGLSLEEFPEEFPLIAKAKKDPEYAARFAGNSKRFQVGPLFFWRATCMRQMNVERFLNFRRERAYPRKRADFAFSGVLTPLRRC